MTGIFRKISALLAAGWLVLMPSCGKKEPLPQPDLTRMKAICQLSVMDCYYHNVVKFRQEDASQFLWLTWDKYFWIEYDGVVTLGIDISQLDMDMDDKRVKIELRGTESVYHTYQSTQRDGYKKYTRQRKRGKSRKHFIGISAHLKQRRAHARHGAHNPAGGQVGSRKNNCPRYTQRYRKICR